MYYEVPPQYCPRFPLLQLGSHGFLDGKITVTFDVWFDMVQNFSATFLPRRDITNINTNTVSFSPSGVMSYFQLVQSEKRHWLRDWGRGWRWSEWRPTSSGQWPQPRCRSAQGPRGSQIPWRTSAWQPRGCTLAPAHTSRVSTEVSWYIVRDH